MRAISLLFYTHENKIIDDTTVMVKELPIGKWTQVYKEFLETLIESNEIIDYKNNCDEALINFKIVMQKTVIDDLIEKNELIKKLKLTSTVNTSNMHVFDEECKIRKVSCPEEIIFRFYNIRKNHYIKRKVYLIDKLNAELQLLNSKIKFINYVINEKIIVFNKKKDFIIKQISDIGDLIKVNNSWDYLLDLKIHFLTSEKILDLISKMKIMEAELETLKITTISDTWNSELFALDF